MSDITVMDVFRDMRLDPSPHLAWTVGAAVRRLYEARHGELPPKALRTKSSGAGSHCFAVYPESWRAEIERVISEHNPATSPQGDLF